MALFNFPEVFAELDLLDSLERRTQRITAATRFLNPAIIQNTANLAARHPTLPAPFITAALFMNIGDWPSVEDIATRSQVEKDRPNYDYRVASRDRKLTDQYLEANPRQYVERENPLASFAPGDLALRGAKGIVRGAFTLFDSAFEEFANAPVRDAVQNYREAGGGLEGGINAASTIATQFNPTTAFGLVGGQGHGRNEAQGKSPLGLLVKQYVNGDPPSRVNLGSGLLPAQDPQPEGMTDEQYISKYGLPINALSHQKREELQIGHRFGGSTSVSPGRLLFNNVVQPGSRPHTILSGLTDVAWNIAADPTSAVGKPISAARKASKVFRASRGVIDDGVRFTVDGVVGRSWLDSDEGELVATILSNRKTISELRDILPEIKDRKLLAALKVADTPTKVKQLLQPELGTGITKVPYSGGLLHRVAGTPTLGEVTSYLPFVDKDMARIAGFLPAIGRQFKSTRVGRVFERSPGLHLSAGNLDQAFDDVDRWMRDVGFDSDLREKHLNQWANIGDNNATQMYGAARSLMADSSKRMLDELDNDTLTKKILGKPIPKSSSKSIIRSVHTLFQTMEDGTAYFIDEVGQSAWFPGAKTHDLSGNVFPTPHTMSEHLTSAVSLPKVQDINRVMGRLHRYGGVAKISPTLLTRVADAALTKVWKPVALMSVAWPLKVISEEQVRLWFHGMRSTFNDPLQTIAALTFGKIDPKNKLKAFDIMGNDLRALDSTNPRDVVGILDHYRSAMSRGHNGYLGTATNPIGLSRQFTKKYKGQSDDFFQDWADVELSTLANDDIAPRIIREGPESVKQWFWFDKEGRKLRQSLAESVPEDGHRLLEDREFANTFIDSYNARIHMKTGGQVDIIPGGGYVVNKPGNSDLLRVIKNGSFTRKSPRIMPKPTLDQINRHKDEVADLNNRITQAINDGDDKAKNILTKERAKINKQIDKLRKTPKVPQGEDVNFSLRPDSDNYDPSGFGDFLATNYADSAPPVIKGVNKSIIDRSRDPGLWDRAVDTMFNFAMSKPTNFLSRSPAFDQSFWGKVNDLMPYIDDADRATLSKAAQKTKRNLDFNQPFSGERLGLDEIEEISGVHAAEEVKSLLYDNSRRLNWAESSRNIFPFAEAWVEVTKTWMRLLSENPEKIRRLQQGIGAARQEGFISVDEESGEQYYNIPGAGMLEDVFGIDSGPLRSMFTGSVDSLNPLRGGYMPGFGPAVQIPLAYLMPQTPDYDWIRDMVAPFGVEKIEEPEDILGHAIPRGLSNVLDATLFFDPKDNTRQAGMVSDIFNQMVLSGEVDISNPDEQKAALEKARTTARRFDLIRSVAGIFIPGGARFRQEAKDQAGKWTIVEAIANKYNKIEANDGREAAEDWMLDNYSLTIGELMDGATMAVRKRPVTETAWAFQRDHPEVYETLPNTGYYIFPDQENDKFERDAWLDQLESGERVILTPEQKQLSENQIEAYGFRDEALAVLVESGITPTSDEGRELMRTVDDYLKSEYPGYSKVNVGVPQKPDQEMMLDELRTWKNIDGPITESRTWQAVVQFMDNMDGAQQIITDTTGLTTMESSSNPLAIAARQSLFQLGEDEAAKDPGFRAVWEDVLKQSVLTRQDQIGLEDDEPFEQLNRRLGNQPGLFSDSTDQPTVLVP